MRKINIIFDQYCDKKRREKKEFYNITFKNIEVRLTIVDM